MQGILCVGCLAVNRTWESAAIFRNWLEYLSGGARGTFYFTSGLVDQWPGHWTGVSADEIVALLRRGYEVACHTVQFLRSTPLIETNIDRDGIDRVFDEAVAGNGRLIFYGHDVKAAPSPYGCSPTMLRHALEAASRRKIQILSVAQALKRAGA
ncbi:hypothetical protein [Bradyrhizobium sp.]|uniref:hypothetical protein n=1 Tax=Bradyrhizobium sp. TaxID=376 RepID=UPI0025C2D0CC|nr:hypothetical protein [Bradyrhizobium sp.]